MGNSFNVFYRNSYNRLLYREEKGLNRKFHSVLCWLHFHLVLVFVPLGLWRCHSKMLSILDIKPLSSPVLLANSDLSRTAQGLVPRARLSQLWGSWGSKQAEKLQCRGQSRLSDPQGSDGAVGARGLLKPQNWGSAPRYAKAEKQPFCLGQDFPDSTGVLEGRKGVHAFGLHRAVRRFVF